MLRHLLEARIFISNCIKVSSSSHEKKIPLGKASLEQLDTGTSVLMVKALNLPFFFFFFNEKESGYFFMYIQRPFKFFEM